MKRAMRKSVTKSHAWRKVGHDQLADLYLSMGIRTTAVSLVNVFLPIYLHQLGYSIQDIVGYYALFSILRIVINLPVAKVIGAIGPKHSMAASTVGSIIYMITLFSLESVGWPLVMLAAVHTTSNSLFFTAYHTDFSKVKKPGDSGKELGHMMIVQKLGRVVGPMVGGLLAGFADIRVSIAVSAVLLLASLIPLFMTEEPVHAHQKVSYRGVWGGIVSNWQNTLARCSENMSIVLVGAFWSFYLALTVFSESPYESIGLLTTGATFLSLFSAHLIGSLTDGGHGRVLLRVAASLNVVLACCRAIISAPLGAITHDVVRQQTEPGVSIPIVKGYYDNTDDYPGHRIAYITIMESLVHFYRSVVLITVLLLMGAYDSLEVLRYATVVIGLLGSLVVLERYRVLD